MLSIMTSKMTCVYSKPFDTLTIRGIGETEIDSVAKAIGYVIDFFEPKEVEQYVTTIREEDNSFTLYFKCRK